MGPTLTHVAAIVAGLAIVATGFTVMPAKGPLNAGLLKSLGLAMALAVMAALLITVIRQFG